MRALALSWAAAAVFMGSAQAADEPVDKGYRGHFVRTGPVFACGVDASQNPKADELAEDVDGACLHMGRLAIGSDAKLVKDMGKPDQVQDEAPGLKNLIFIQGDDATAPYIVVTVSKTRVHALQISGDKPIRDWSFNGLMLGDSVDTLKKIFGEPGKITPVDGGDLWGYWPWTFSFMVANGKVTSIRISTKELA